MSIKAVLTGDLIRSSKTGNPAAFVAALQAVLRQLKRAYKVKTETFRGDGFQVVLKDTRQGLRCSLALRAGLIAASPPGERWDARVAVGIGRAVGRSSYGEAFVLSGQGLDKMRKSTLSVFTSDAHLRERIDLTTEFVAAIVDQWTVVEAKTFYVHLLEGADQQATAEVLGKSRITVNKALQRAQAGLLERYLNCTENWIGELIDA